MYSLRNPIGAKPLRKLAENKRGVVIIFDDLTRPTRAFEIVPYMIDEIRKSRN